MRVTENRFHRNYAVGAPVVHVILFAHVDSQVRLYLSKVTKVSNHGVLELILVADEVHQLGCIGHAIYICKVDLDEVEPAVA